VPFNQKYKLKRKFLDNAEAALGEKTSKPAPEEQVNMNEVYSQIGQLKVETGSQKNSPKTGHYVSHVPPSSHSTHSVCAARHSSQRNLQ